MIKLVQCEDCTLCKVKYWWVHCNKNVWQFEMLNNSSFNSFERQGLERPIIDIPKRLNNNACGCEYFDDVDEEG